MKKNKNEELQSRRQFFKKAAKATLPILSIAVLAGNPVMAKAANVVMGCTGSNCHGACVGSCKGCMQTCVGGCKNYACKGAARG